MKAGVQIATACALALICFSRPVFADELGNKIAAVLCHDSETYTLSEDEAAAWNQAHEGTYVGSPSKYEFKKSAGIDSGTCTARTTIPPDTATAKVTKARNILTRGTYLKNSSTIF